MASKIEKQISNILSPETCFDDRFIPDREHLKKIIKELKKRGHKIVLTQGVWDLIHEGHALYLKKAKEQGDVLIVGVDSDKLTKKRKGPSRPIVPHGERLNMLVHLRHVDIVALREVNNDLGGLIRLVQPDVLITSKSTSDFTKKHKNKYEEDCGEIVTLPRQATTTTTARIRNLTIGGAEKLANEIKKKTEEFVQQIREGN